MSEAEIIPPFVVIDQYFVGSEGAAMPLFECIESHDSAMAAMALNDLLARIAERDKTISFQAEATALMADEVMRLVDELTAERDRLADENAKLREDAADYAWLIAAMLKDKDFLGINEATLRDGLRMERKAQG